VAAGWFEAGGTIRLSSATLFFSLVIVVPLAQSCAGCPFPAWIVPDRFLCCTGNNVTRSHRDASVAQAVGPDKPQPVILIEGRLCHHRGMRNGFSDLLTYCSSRQTHTHPSHWNALGDSDIVDGTPAQVKPVRHCVTFLNASIRTGGKGIARMLSLVGE